MKKSELVHVLRETTSSDFLFMHLVREPYF